MSKDKTFHITISELTAKTVEVKAKNSDMAWDKVQNDGYWEYEQVGDDECIEWNYATCEEVKEDNGVEFSNDGVSREMLTGKGRHEQKGEK